jgi:hypothetical protein
MDLQCDLCRMRRAGYRTSESLPYLNDHICEECLTPPTCSSCHSSSLKIEGDIQWGVQTCLDCGYSIIHTIPELPSHFKGKFTEEILKWADENTTYFIEILPEKYLQNLRK